MCNRLFGGRDLYGGPRRGRPLLVVVQPDRNGCYSGSRGITFTLGGDGSEILRDPPQGGRTGRIDPVGKDRTGGGLPPAECADPAVGRPGRTRTWTTRHGDRGAGGGHTPQTVEKVRKRCVQDGFAATLERRKRSRERATVLDGEGEAQLVAIACSDAPVGRTRWTLHMLCDELKRRRVVRSISHETVRKVLKKTSSSRGDRRCGVSRHSRTLPSCARWRTCWKCIPGRTMRPIR